MINPIPRITAPVRNFFFKRGMYGMPDILAFLAITLIIHFAWRFWERELDLWPVAGHITRWMDGLAYGVLHQSVWLLNTVMGYGVTIDGQIMRFPSGYDISIGRSCSGMKQIAQFLLLMAVYRGSWIKKMWFIPLGVVFVHLANLSRIFFSGVLSMTRPEWMQPAHDQVLRWVFYLVICGLWLFWVKRMEPVRRDLGG